MLHLTRKLNESIMIGDNVCVTITRIEGQYIRVSITAPPTIPVHREEVYKRIVAERQGLCKPYVRPTLKLPVPARITETTE